MIIFVAVVIGFFFTWCVYLNILAISIYRQLNKVIVYAAEMEERLNTAIEVIDGILDQRIQEITDDQFDNIVDALEDEDMWPDPDAE